MEEALKWLAPFLGFFGGLVAVWIALRKEDRAIEIKQITEERKRWREEIRKITLEIVTALVAAEHDKKTAASLRCRLALNLNPKDQNDNEILSHLDELFATKKDDIAQFEMRITLLLKHDWERSKWDRSSAVGM